MPVRSGLLVPAIDPLVLGDRLPKVARTMAKARSVVANLPISVERRDLSAWPGPLLVDVRNYVPAAVRDDRPHESRLCIIETSGKKCLLALVAATGRTKWGDVGVVFG